LPTRGALTYNDSLGAFLLDCCRIARIAVPKSIAVVGIDNDELVCESCTPPLSSVQAPSEQLGFAAASVLARMLSDEFIPPAHVEMLPGDCFVVARGSSTPTATSDPIIQSAMAIIRARFQDNISVSDLYRRQNISRRAFEYRFRRAMGCGPYEMILKMRVEHAKALLLNTPGKMHMIAYQCGFNSETRFCENFRRLTGVTPGQYRAGISGRRRPARRRK
jgi:LacI family transcriptional regulator